MNYNYDLNSGEKRWYFSFFHSYLHVFEKYIENVWITDSHAFLPFTPTLASKDNGGSRLFLESNFLDKLVIFSLLEQPGYGIQHEMDLLVNDETMPLPPAAAFLNSDNPWPYTNWRNDYTLWKLLPEYYGYKGYKYYLQTDLSNFFDSVDIPALLDKISPYLSEPRHLNLISAYLKNSISWNGNTIKRPNGLPTGEPVSHLLANLYLMSFDKWIVSKSIPYARYVDDMRFFAHTKEECLKIRDEISAFLHIHFNLKINLTKTRFEEIHVEENIFQAENLAQKIKVLIETSRQAPDYFRNYRFASTEEIVPVIEKLKESAPSKNVSPTKSNSASEADKTVSILSDFARMNSSHENQIEFSQTLFGLLDWVFSQPFSDYITGLLRIICAKLSYYQPQKLAGKVAHLLNSEYFSWRMVAVRAIARSQDNDSMNRLTIHLRMLFEDIDKNMIEIKKILEILLQYHSISSDIIQFVKESNNSELYNYILPSIFELDELLSVLNNTDDSSSKELAAIQIYRLKPIIPAVFETWKKLILQVTNNHDLKIIVLIWTEFLAFNFNVKDYIFQHLESFSPFELALFKEAIAISEKPQPETPSPDNTFQSKSPTDKILDEIELSFSADDDESDTHYHN